MCFVCVKDCASNVKGTTAYPSQLPSITYVCMYLYACISYTVFICVYISKFTSDIKCIHSHFRALPVTS